eukprot:CAMPEP_0176492050 /NCGR_PEP_ID=MMETSP0200_2-20121128/8765_1 /TAXON_ID=947934 /ORGANISM="Chaetoceros sp., Strain GSL56" /LENGTH=404 /DNA_ID=CAMNT_0017889533 /DNA_START=91 /DNA_END=1305 /DNA_ORIENTATION=+
MHFSFLILLYQLIWSTTAVTALTVRPAYTSAVIKVCYDGTLFHGWSASNKKESVSDLNSNDILQEPKSQKRTRSRRNKFRPSIKVGEVRSVEQSIKSALAKLYGNVPMNKIVVEGSSRTDKGVHSVSSYALIYCISDYAGPLSIPGKKLPHPRNPYDEAFQELPFKSDMHHLVSALNKMLPPDVKVVDISPMPTIRSGKNEPFHPSLDSVKKTYRYTFSLGAIHDPIRCRAVWYSPHRSSIDLDRADKCAEILSGTHDFVAFRGAFRGNERSKTQDTVCTIYDISIFEEAGLGLQGANDCLSNLSKTFCIDITGDRFLYKQVRFMVGAIIELSTSDNLPEDILNLIFKNKEWPEKGVHSFPRLCAPSHGLCLVNVKFDQKWTFQWLYADKNASDTSSVDKLVIS